MPFLSGKDVKVRYGSGQSTTLRCVGGSVTPRVESHDVTNGESSGVGEYIAGVFDLDVDLECDYYYSVAAGPYVTLLPGTTITGTRLYLNGTSGVYWDIPSILVTQHPMEWRTRGKITTRFRGQGMGAIVAPTG